MFLYFDLGNVLLYFSHELACEQMGRLARLPAEQIREVLFQSGMLEQIETGKVNRRQAYEAFCQATGTCVDADELEYAASNIFRVNYSMLPVVARLKDAGYRLGILSNTSESHWRHVLAHYKALFPDMFDVLALSFKIGAMKPDLAIYKRAAELAGVPPEECFCCDDIPANVEAARQAGFDAVAYTDTPAFVEELRRRGVRFNY